MSTIMLDIFDFLPRIPATLPIPIEAKTIVLAKRGVVTVNFDKPFAKTPVVVGVYHNFRGSFPSLTIAPFSISLGKVTLPSIQISKLVNISLPRIPSFNPPINKVRPWGDIWFDVWMNNVPNYPILAQIGQAIGQLLRLVGNQFFFTYYSLTGDFKVIAEAIATPIINEMVNAINDYVNNVLNARLKEIETQINNALLITETNINTQIASTEAHINSIISRLERDIENAANTTIDRIMQGYGLAKDLLGRFPIPMPFNPLVVTPFGFMIENPQDNTIISYIAIAIP